MKGTRIFFAFALLEHFQACIALTQRRIFFTFTCLPKTSNTLECKRQRRRQATKGAQIIVNSSFSSSFSRRVVNRLTSKQSSSESLELEPRILELWKKRCEQKHTHFFGWLIESKTKSRQAKTGSKKSISFWKQSFFYIIEEQNPSHCPFPLRSVSVCSSTQFGLLKSNKKSVKESSSSSFTQNHRIRAFAARTQAKGKPK